MYGLNEEERRQRAVMRVRPPPSSLPFSGSSDAQLTLSQEVLPNAAMWRKWEKTEAPLRQGRGWYPTLVRPWPSPSRPLSLLLKVLMYLPNPISPTTSQLLSPIVLTPAAHISLLINRTATF